MGALLGKRRTFEVSGEFSSLDGLFSVLDREIGKGLADDFKRFRTCGDSGFDHAACCDIDGGRWLNAQFFCHFARSGDDF